MEVVMPMNTSSFPSSPRFDYYDHYTSAPSSPTRVAALYAAYEWEKEIPSYKKSGAYQDDDYVFEFSGQFEKGVLPPELADADDLFEEGIIRPLRPSSEGARERGRERMQQKQVTASSPSSVSIPSASRSRKGSRSLSPMRREHRGLFMHEHEQSRTQQASTSATSSSAEKSRGGSRKWRLKDLLLFRSASEGRVTGNRSKDPLRKYTLLPSTKESTGSSFRSADGSVGSSARKSSVSAHEMHYKSNRAASEEMRKKTPLPFVRHGLFGCLRYNPAVQSIARGFQNSSAFGRRRS